MYGILVTIYNLTKFRFCGGFADSSEQTFNFFLKFTFKKIWVAFEQTRRIGSGKRRYRVSPIIHCCNSTTPYWITAPPILFYMVPCKEGHLCACNILGKHQPLVKRLNISCESYEWALFSKVTLFTNGSGCLGTIVLWRCQKVMRTN